MSYSNSYIEWHAMNVSNPFMFITNRKQDSLISACFDNLQNYTKKGYKTSCQEIAGGSVEQKCFRMMNILLQLWPGNLASQMKNLNNEIESNWKKAFSHPENTKLVHKNKRDASLLPCYICLFAGPTTCGTRAAWLVLWIFPGTWRSNSMHWFCFHMFLIVLSHSLLPVLIKAKSIFISSF